MARYWSINTAATAVPLSAHPSHIEVAATKLVAAILGGGCSEEVFCRLSTAPVDRAGENNVESVGVLFHAC